MLYTIIMFPMGLILLFFQALCVRSCLRVYKLTRSHDLMRKNETCPDAWKPFIRPPGHLLHPLHVALWRAITTAPLRYIAILSVLIITTTSTAFLSPKAGLYIAHIGGRIVAYLVGVTKTRFVGAPASAGEAPLIVVNHVSWVDFIVLAATTEFGFVMSEAVSNAPIVGPGFTRLALKVGSVILDRGEVKSREAAKEKIGVRLNTLLREKMGERLMIFPEGTLTSGEYLVPFKLGFFATLPPVQPLRLEFSNPHYSLSDLGTLEGTAFFLCLDSTELLFTWGDVVAPVKGDTPETLAERARTELVRGSNIKLSMVGSFRDHKSLFAASD